MQFSLKVSMDIERTAWHGPLSKAPIFTQIIGTVIYQIITIIIFQTSQKVSTS
jgi:hypothetical protein